MKIKNRIILINRQAKRWKSISILLSFLATSFSNAIAQSSQQDTLTLSRHQYEELFLKQNLLLLSEKLNINRADALVVQAKLWPNPTLNIDELNLWTTKKQLSNLEAPLPPLFGGFAKNTQFSIQLEQLIQTAGKRKKKVALEKVSVNLATQQFEDVLRTLKLELRNFLIRLHYLQTYIEVFAEQQSSIQNLLNNAQRQVENGNLSKGEFMRLKLLQLELSKEENELGRKRNEIEAELKILLNISAPLHLSLKEENWVPELNKIKEMRLNDLYALAMEERPDLKVAKLENSHYSKLVQYEKSQRVPDFTLLGSYDREGGIWPSFLGFGLAIDLPLFNRNQGQINHARIGMDQTHILINEKRLRVQTEVEQSYKDLLSTIQMYENIESPYEQDLDLLLTHYIKNFINRNVNLLELLDFWEAYLGSKRIFLEFQKDIHLNLEKLQFSIGKEIKRHEH